VVIDQINIRGVALLKAKNNPPVGAYRDAPISGQVASQRMQAEAGQVELIRFRRLVEARQHAGDFVRMLRVQLAPVVVFIKPPQAAMSKAPDHSNNNI
jgi:hypothetical protein